MIKDKKRREVVRMNILLTVLKRFFRERFHDQSAQMAYFFMLSVFPLLIFILSLLSFLPFATSDILAGIEQFTPSSSQSLIESNVYAIFNEQRSKVASVSLLAAFWVSSMAVQSLVRSMNNAYGIERKENFLMALMKDLFLTAALMATLMVSLLVPIGEELGRLLLNKQEFFPAISQPLWLVTKWGIGSLYLFLFFLILYKLVPSAKMKLRSMIPGSVFSTIGWQAVSVGFSYYVSYVNYSILYGQLGSIVVLMIWFYLTAAVLLIGGLVNYAFMAKDLRD